MIARRFPTLKIMNAAVIVKKANAIGNVSKEIRHNL